MHSLTRLFAGMALAASVVSCAHTRATTSSTSTTSATASPVATATTLDKSLPPAEEAAKAALEASPRHGEFVDIKIPGDNTPLRTYVVYPERKDKAGVVLLIHEIFGLSDWMRGVADQLAADGFIAVAPDLISGLGQGGGGTDSAASRDDVVKLVRGLSPEESAARIAAVRAWAVKIPSANGKLATLGFCWGGARSFEVAAASPPPTAAIVYYGSSPDSATLLKVEAPVFGFYGADDARVNATIEPATKALAARKKTFAMQTYKGAGHGFLRQQSGREGANLAATKATWPRTLALLRQHLK